MSHRKQLTRGVFFSYVALIAQISYSFLSVPLALSHLSTAEFGMWGLISTVGSYLMMAEFGMTESFMRYLFECKNGRDPERYGRLFTASCLTLGIASLVVLLGGSLTAVFAATALGVPESLRGDFIRLMLGTSAFGAILLNSRMLGIPLILHHRQDLAQIAQIGLFIVRLAVIYLAFHAGWGIYSLLAVDVAGAFWILPFNAWMCHRNGYFPKKGTFALPSRAEWAEIRNYSVSAFLIQIGGTFLIGLPQLLISSYIGLSAAGLWTVYTRVFGILRDIAFRPFGIAIPMLIDFFVKGEVSRSVHRWVQVSQLVMAAAGFSFAVAAVHNTRFVGLWTGVESDWGLGMSSCIAFYFLCYCAAGCPYGVISFSKKFGIARVIPILQGLLVAGIAYGVAKFHGSAGIILTAALGFLLGMALFGMRQLGRVTGSNPFKLVVQAIARPFLVSPLVFAAAWMIERQTTTVPGYLGLFLSAGLSSMIGLPMMAFLGVSRSVRGELFNMVLKPVRRFIPARFRAAAASGSAGGPQ